MGGGLLFSYEEKMLNKVALIDSDGVLSGFVEGVYRLVREEAGTTLCDQDFSPSWNFLSELPRVLEAKGVSKANVVTSQVLRRMEEPGFCLSLPVLPGSVDAMKRLASKYQLYIATSPWWSFPHWMPERTRWIQQHYGLSASRIIHISDKHLLRGDLLVDDKPSTVRKWAAINDCTNPAFSPALLWSTYFNQGDEGTGLRRVGSWEEVFALADV